PGGAIPGGGGEPPPVEPPPPPAPLMARGVLYTQDTSAGQAKLTVDLLAEKAASTGEALPAAGDVNFLFYDKDGNGPLSSSPFAAVYAPDGSITFTYSGSYSAPGVYYCVINDSAGHSYSMQLVVTADTFDSANPEYALPAGWALWDTWHEGQNASTGYSGVGYRVASSDVNDSLSFMGQLYQAAVAAGDGDNTISVSASADNGNAYAMNTSYITTGNGDDSITISAQGDAGSYAMQNSYITTGDGDDSITISAQGGTGNYAMQNSYITTGDGDDSITISAQGGTDSYAMQNSDITTGGGADHVTLIGDVVSTTANAHKIDLGAGNDSLMITGNVSGMDLDGGANDLIFHADDDGGIAVLGDILGLTSANYADVLAAGNANTIKNFESLLVDMQDNSETLDALLAGVDNLQTKQGIPSGANDNGHVQSLIVTTSNGADELKLGSVALDVAAQVHSEVTIEGVVGCFTHYQIDVGSGPLDLYIQQELLKA
ncbi:MAG: hypothetical protein FWH34_07015, partial [Desulfovibrionaceae bacterium]|nr:hypothetical protein [Desulfovibrionaceae bacterium]